MPKPRALTELRLQLVRTFQDPKYKPPPLPSVALDLVLVCGREDVTIDDVVRLLERDEMLAGAVMQLIASPLYSGRGTIHSLREAVVRLGARTVRDVVFEAALQRSVFNLPEYGEIIERIQRHSTVTAYLCRVICRHAQVDAEHAFLCGLLHDVGFAALLYALAAKKNTSAPPLPEIWPHLDQTHEYASNVLTRLWKLPPDISAVVGQHHHVHTGATARLAAVINIADHLTERFDAHIIGPAGSDGIPLLADVVTPTEMHDSQSVLRIDDSRMGGLLADAERIVAQIPG